MSQQKALAASLGTERSLQEIAVDTGVGRIRLLYLGILIARYENLLGDCR